MLYINMCNINWTLLYTIDDVDLASQIFTDTILTVFDRHAPFTKIKIYDNQPKWVKGDSLGAIDKKEHWRNVHKRRLSPYNEARKREATKRVPKKSSH